ncbi:MULTISPECIES: 2-hydroxyacid dehydrogenase family protein [Lacticaseibacillus]|uniref:Dehydrogenase n=1 Tax=Lacticaseibacillus casei DSM 20011 = JCM 1134 = ATCC 393 TaxID=1423732 RepID=A0AAD1ERX6_LACCA|nr:2-hydroxyacid dehydrogenase family protein [Lacticaseibacillus casei]MBI6598312.1 2-hydroxyacid dehydrogenase family protein [Lacticaseibacillus casei]MBO1481936.1 2-hydroxyacid dehydrogenase family protein [Lacticaseibacillus casei]MBO2417235.1 2-hydroxyacid dehydrogenase family protein [Lacticaseibacillus casei]MCK2081604.1 2-hydroxyacid dehydrogenase family protein [Lacticaseibacillus casei]MDZ5496537.1 2-hydroxyacid dehydrogenase family protein [Lacticaseibacillus casei]
MPQVYVSAALPKSANAALQKAGVDFDAYNGKGLITEDELQSHLANTEVLITALSTPVTAATLAKAPHLKPIANYGAGFNNIDVTAAKAQGVLVTNTPKVSTTSTAEVTLALMLAVLHRVTEGDRLMHGPGFSGWAPTFFLGHELAGKTVGIIGMGQIGQAVAKRVHAFNAKILYTQHHQLTPEAEQALGATFTDRATLLQQSDIVTLHLPLVPATHHLLDAQALATMKPTAYLINAARGPLIDETALLKQLNEHRLAGAALDVYEAEPHVSSGLKALDNVVLTPNIGNATVEAHDAMAKIVTDNTLAVLNGKQPQYVVNG